VQLVLFLILSQIASASEVDFVENHLKIESCKFDKPFIAIALQTGLGRVSEVNPNLVEEIKKRSFGMDLTVVCDVTDKNNPIFFRPRDNSIHLRVTNDGSGNTNSNFFHEFLHFAGLVHIDLPDDAASLDVFSLDPVYACHLTGFPEMEKSLKLDPAILPLAVKKCSTVTYENAGIQEYN
jgi:hypothetical protein